MKRSLFFGTLALILLFFKLPFTCKGCHVADMTLPMLAATYFSIFMACIICFPKWPSRHVKIAGLVWSIGLAITLTYLSPAWCVLCIMAHLCNIAMWIFWKPRFVQKRIPQFIKIPLIMMSLLVFPLTFYGIEKKDAPRVKPGVTLKSFAQTQHKGMILNFASPDCTHCKTQIATLNKTAEAFQEIRVIVISPQLSDEMQAHGPHLEWIEDEKGNIAPLFGIQALPTTVLLTPDGTILKTGVGAPIDFKETIFRLL